MGRREVYCGYRMAERQNTVIGWFTGTRDEAKQVDWSGVGEGITNGTEGGITGLWSDFKSRVVSKFKSLVNSVKAHWALRPRRRFSNLSAAS